MATEAGIGLSISAPGEPRVYVLVVGGIVKCVGLTEMGFTKRMYNYSKPGITQRTSQRINRVITEHAAAGTEVKLFIAVTPALEWNGSPIHTAAAIPAG